MMGKGGREGQWMIGVRGKENDAKTGKLQIQW